MIVEHDGQKQATPSTPKPTIYPERELHRRQLEVACCAGVSDEQLGMFQLAEILFQAKSLIRQLVIGMSQQAQGKAFAIEPAAMCSAIAYFLENAQADLNARPYDLKGYPIPPEEQLSTTVDGIVAAEDKQGDGTEREGVSEIDTAPPEKPQMPSVEPEPERVPQCESSDKTISGPNTASG